MAVKDTVNLSESEREQLQEITSKGKIAARKLKRAQILLLADEGHRDDKIAQMLLLGQSTVHRTRQRCVEEGVEKALTERPRPGSKAKLDVLDNLNTHTPASLYKAFSPEEAKRILDRLEFHYTPKHGSW